MALKLQDSIASKLQSAVRRNDLTELREFTKAQPNEGMDVLSMAAFSIEHNVFEVLEPSFPTRGLTLMHIAALYDSFEVFMFLINRGFSIDIKSANDYQPIHYAAIGNSREVLTYICSQKSPSLYSTGVVLDPLYLATAAKSPENVKILLESGVKPGDACISGAIKRAVSNGNSGCLSLLLDAANSSSKGGILADFHNFSTLMRAIAKNCLEAVPILIESGVNPDYMTPDGKSALYLACSFSGSEEIVEMLIDAGADLLKRGINGQGPVHWAAASSNTNILRLVLRAGADPLVCDDRGTYAMSSVLCSPIQTWYEKFEILLKYKLPINYRSKNGQLLLSSILVQRNVPQEVIRLLLENGADLTLEARPGKTLLAIAQACAPPSTKDVIEKFMQRIQFA